MKKLITLFTLAATSHLIFAEQGTWTQKTSMPSAAINRAECGAFSINGKGYIFGGVIAYPNWLDETWEYDPQSDAWTQKANIPATLREPAFFVIGNKGYAGTGMTGTSTVQTFYEFDPAANKWTAKKNFPGAARRDAVAFAINGKGYMGTGTAGTGKTKDFYEYDPNTDNWKAVASLNGVIRDAAISFTINNKGYVTTGRNGTTYYKDCWEYDAQANAWTQKADFPGVIRSEAVSFEIGAKAYVGSGHTGGANDFFAYNATTNTWDSVPTLPGAEERAEAVAFAVNGKGYVCNGYLKGKGTQKDIWEYTPATSTAINEASLINKFSVFPNPGNGLLTISGKTNSAPLHIAVYSVNGQLSYTTNLTTAQESNLDLRNLAKGTYQLVITNGNYSEKQTIIIE